MKTAIEKQLLSGNEAIALGAYHAGVMIATAYPGTPSTEILEAIAQHQDIYAEWSTNEKVAMEVGLGASYAGRRSLVSMKHVGLNVASDPFLAAATTGINGGLVVISADDPGIHSSQGEQDNRHYARLAKVPMLEPADSQEAYDFMLQAFQISEEFDTPVLMRLTTRLSHSKSLVAIHADRTAPADVTSFKHNIEKYVMLPMYARYRRPYIEERLVKLAQLAETIPFNQIFTGDGSIGIISSGVAYQYAREVFPTASFLKLGMTYPLPRDLIHRFASQVDKIFVIEEIDPFLEEAIKAMGISVVGKQFIPRIGELNPRVVDEAAHTAELVTEKSTDSENVAMATSLPGRPPMLCPGCPHTGLFFVLSTIGKRSKLFDPDSEISPESDLVITGDIGCYTLGTYPPLSSMDTTACMGASIGQAIGIEKAGIAGKITAVIGDSTFLHSGITGLVNAVYDESKITVIILDNSTTAMTGHQEHPGTGVSVQGKKTRAVDIESLCRGIGVKQVNVVNAFDLKALRSTVRTSLDSQELSVIIVRGDCPTRTKARSEPRAIDSEKCNECGTCLKLGCSAIQKDGEHTIIDATLCIGDVCGVCEQVCPQKAMSPLHELKGGK